VKILSTKLEDLCKYFCESTKTGAGTQRIEQIAFYTADLFTDFTGIDYDTMIYLSVKPRLLMKNVDFSNRQKLTVS